MTGHAAPGSWRVIAELPLATGLPPAQTRAERHQWTAPVPDGHVCSCRLTCHHPAGAEGCGIFLTRTNRYGVLCELIARISAATVTALLCWRGSAKGGGVMTRREWQRGWSAGLSVLLGVAVAVLVAVWTGSWEWRAGAGLAALALTWASVEVLRSGHDVTRSGVHIRMRATSVSRSRLVGYEGTVPGSQALDVHQSLGVVEDATVVGVTEIPAAGGDARQGSEIHRPPAK